MATPVVKTEDGTYEYSLSLKRWVCTAGKIPGMSGGANVNCTVHMSMNTSLNRAAYKAGFTSADFGVIPEAEKVVRVKGPRTGKPGVRRSRKPDNFVTLFDLSS